MTDSDHVSALRRRAAAARRISEEVLNPQDRQGLRQLADDLEALADQIEAKSPGSRLTGTGRSER